MRATFQVLWNGGRLPKDRPRTSTAHYYTFVILPDGDGIPERIHHDIQAKQFSDLCNLSVYASK